MRVVVTDRPFDTATEAQGFAAGRQDVGAVVTFSGIVRSEQGRLTGLDIEHYPGMTEKSISRIAEDAVARWRLADVLVIHRYGSLKPGEPIMMVATAAAHRRQAFEAAEFLMDYLKSRAPFWKREVGPDGAQWIPAKEDDEQSLSRWFPGR